MRSHYEVLGVDASADTATIKRAWRDHVLRLHPDRHVGESDEVRAQVAEQTRRVNAAWEELRDDDRRRRYDRLLSQLADAHGASGAPGSGGDRPSSVTCAKCGTTQSVPGAAERFTCVRCRTRWRFVNCDHCDAHRTVNERWGKWSCAECGWVHTSYWGGAVKRVRCVRCKASTDVAVGAPMFHCHGCDREYLLCQCGVYASFHVLFGRHWFCPKCMKWNRRVVDPDAQRREAIQRLLDDRRISAPGAARALADHIGPELDGVARVGVEGRDGVIAVAGDRGALWWNDGRAAEALDLRVFDRVERRGRHIELHGAARPSLHVLASNDRYADAWVAHLVSLGATTTPRLPRVAR